MAFRISNYNGYRAFQIIKNLVTNFHVIFVFGSTLGIQIILLDYYSTSYLNKVEQGNVLYYGKQNLQVHFTDYARSAVYYLTVRPLGLDNRQIDRTSLITVCNRRAFQLHDASGMPVEFAGLFQTLGDTNVHFVSGFVDDRLGIEQTLARLITVGLDPGRNALFCTFPCKDNAGKNRLCSSKANGIILPAGSYSNYKNDEQRQYFMDTYLWSCPVQDKPQTLSIISQRCGFSHNKILLQPFTSQEVVTPPRQLGICVRPDRLDSYTDLQVAEWLETLRILGSDQVLLYVGQTSEGISRVLNYYKNEVFPVVDIKSWQIIEESLESIVSAEAAVMDCIYNNMMKYKYLLILSTMEIPYFKSQVYDLKQLVRSRWFEAKMEETGGLRVTGSQKSGFIVQSRMTLLTAADHFVALTKRPYLQLLDPDVMQVTKMTANPNPDITNMAKGKLKIK